MKFSVKDFVSECEQIRGTLRICLHLLKTSLTENFIVGAVFLLFYFSLGKNGFRKRISKMMVGVETFYWKNTCNGELLKVNFIPKTLH